MISTYWTTLLVFFFLLIDITPVHSFLFHRNNGDGAASLSPYPQGKTIRITIPSLSSKHQGASNNSILHQSPSLPLRKKLSHFARPKSKWDDLIDDDDENDDSNSVSKNIPSDMLYTDVNIRRQMHNFDRLVNVGGRDAMNDVYVRAPGEKEWWLVGKIARVSDVSPEQAIERQWPLIERHVWALRIPIRPTSDLSAPFEVWYAPGDTEYDAARNDPKVKFSKVSGSVLYGGEGVNSSLVGFVGKVYDLGKDEPMVFVERNVEDGSAIQDRYLEGDWILRSEIDDRKRDG